MEFTTKKHWKNPNGKNVSVLSHFSLNVFSVQENNIPHFSCMINAWFNNTVLICSRLQAEMNYQIHPWPLLPVHWNKNVEARVTLSCFTSKNCKSKKTGVQKDRSIFFHCPVCFLWLQHQHFLKAYQNIATILPCITTILLYYWKTDNKSQGI